MVEKVELPAFTFVTKAYCLLTKPGIILGNLVTTAGGFALASRGSFDVFLFFYTLIGIALIIASACVFNNYIDRVADEKMVRTRSRALVKGEIATRSAILFAIVLGSAGSLVLAFLSSPTALIAALLGFFVYVVLYSISKYHSIHGTLIGSVAGALPPIVGYCAVSNSFDRGALILFLIIALWQMPHFFAIAIYRLKDYAAASIPVLPLKKGMKATKIQMALYIIAFTLISSLLFVFDYVGYAYLIATVLLGTLWLLICATGFTCKNDTVWARKMFVFSLVVIMGLCIVIPLSVIST